MKLFLISLGVLGGHLLLLAWMQVAAPANSVAPKVMQIDLRPPALARLPAAPAAKQPTAPAKTQTRQPLVTHEVAPPKSAAPQTLSPESQVIQVPMGPPDTATPKPGTTSAASPPQSANATPGGDTVPAPVVHWPSSQADYLQNPAPAYPPLSQRLGEQGKVVVRVLIGQNGRAQRADIARSSGFERLDQAALKAVLSWRYVAGTVNGQPQDMWFDVPVNFKLPD